MTDIEVAECLLDLGFVDCERVIGMIAYANEIDGVNVDAIVSTIDDKIVLMGAINYDSQISPVKELCYVNMTHKELKKELDELIQKAKKC